MRQYPVNDKELTLLAEGNGYALLGDSTGTILRIGAAELAPIIDTLAQPTLVPCPPESAPQVLGYKITVRLDIPPGEVLYFNYRTDPVSGITVYVAYEKPRNLWYVRELRGKDGKGTGKYSRTEPESGAAPPG